ncbi:hypothetical protein K488DRAFT_75059 [Vararia minispora EC-137]|uniref:Uncharacterized protein n=1 Tax=Vararia minispora EC-137 TaxID=1314806 RepID=A0ACB8Q5C0_9AGAM|nr:hypothetical protein K488DRAFT_75059 [Vararia minispora EC-137]
MTAPAPMPSATAVQNDPDGVIIPNQILGITIPDAAPSPPCKEDYRSVTFWYKCIWNKVRSEQKGISQDGSRRRGGWNLANDVVKALAFLEHEDGDMISADEEAKAINTDTRLLLSHLLNIGICPITLSDTYNHPKVNIIIIAVLEDKHPCISLCNKNWKAHKVLSTVFSSFKQSNETEIYKRMWHRLRPNAASDAKSRRAHLQQEKEERERLKQNRSEDAPITHKKQREFSTVPISMSVQPSASSPLVTSQPIFVYDKPALESTEATLISNDLALTAGDIPAPLPLRPVHIFPGPAPKSLAMSTEHLAIFAKPVAASAEPVAMSAESVAISAESVASSSEPTLTVSSSLQHGRALYDYVSADDNAAILTERIEQIIGDSYQYMLTQVPMQKLPLLPADSQLRATSPSALSLPVDPIAENLLDGMEFTGLFRPVLILYLLAQALFKVFNGLVKSDF